MFQLIYIFLLYPPHPDLLLSRRRRTKKLPLLLGMSRLAKQTISRGLRWGTKHSIFRNSFILLKSKLLYDIFCRYFSKKTLFSFSLFYLRNIKIINNLYFFYSTIVFFEIPFLNRNFRFRILTIRTSPFLKGSTSNLYFFTRTI